jgi:hypothetical protein
MAVPALGTLLNRCACWAGNTSSDQPARDQRADRLLAEIADCHGFAPGRAWVFDSRPTLINCRASRAQAMQRCTGARWRTSCTHSPTSARVCNETGAPPS